MRLRTAYMLKMLVSCALLMVRREGGEESEGNQGQGGKI